MAESAVFKVLFQTTADLAGAEAQTAAIKDQTAAVKELETATKSASSSKPDVKEFLAGIKQEAEVMAGVKKMRQEAEKTTRDLADAERKAAAAVGESTAAHGHSRKEMDALRRAATSVKEATWAYKNILKGDFVTAAHEAKFAMVGLNAAMSANPAAKWVAGASLLIAVLGELFGHSKSAKKGLKEVGDAAESGAGKMKAAQEKNKVALADFTSGVGDAISAVHSLRKAKDELADALTAEQLAGVDAEVAGGGMTEFEGSQAKAKIRGDSERARAAERMRTLEDEAKVRDRAFHALRMEEDLLKEDGKARVLAQEAADRAAKFERKHGVANQFLEGRASDAAGRAANPLARMSPADIATARKKLEEDQAAEQRQYAAEQAKLRTAGVSESTTNQGAVSKVTAEARAEAVKKSNRELAEKKRGEQEAEKDASAFEKEIFKGVGEEGRKADAAAKKAAKEEAGARARRVAARDAGEGGESLLKGSGRTGAKAAREAFAAVKDGVTGDEAEAVQAATSELVSALKGRDRGLATQLQKLANEIKKLASRQANSRSFSSESEG